MEESWLNLSRPPATPAVFTGGTFNSAVIIIFYFLIPLLAAGAIIVVYLKRKRHGKKD